MATCKIKTSNVVMHRMRIPLHTALICPDQDYFKYRTTLRNAHYINLDFSHNPTVTHNSFIALYSFCSYLINLVSANLSPNPNHTYNGIQTILQP